MTAPAEEAVKQTGPRPYDLANQDRIVRGRMPTLEIVNERFARNFRLGMFNFMRRNPEVSVGAVKVQKYGAFLADVVVPANINVMHLAPLRGNGLLICEPQLVFAIIDSLFGGSGRFHTRIEGRDFSPTEQRIIRRLVDVVCEGYRQAWQGIYPLSLEYQRSEMQPQFASVAALGELVVTTSFAVELGGTVGSLHLCFPYAALEPIRDTLFSSVQTDQQVTDRRWVTLLTQQIKAADLDVVVELGQARASLGELMSLKVGDFIELDLAETVDAKVDGVPMLRGRMGLSNGRYAIKVEQFVSRIEEDTQGAPDGHR